MSFPIEIFINIISYVHNKSNIRLTCKLFANLINVFDHCHEDIKFNYAMKFNDIELINLLFDSVSVNGLHIRYALLNRNHNILSRLLNKYVCCSRQIIMENKDIIFDDIESIKILSRNKNKVSSYFCDIIINIIPNNKLTDDIVNLLLLDYISEENIVILFYKTLETNLKNSQISIYEQIKKNERLGMLNIRKVIVDINLDTKLFNIFVNRINFDLKYFNIELTSFVIQLLYSTPDNYEDKIKTLKKYLFPPYTSFNFYKQSDFIFYQYFNNKEIIERTRNLGIFDSLFNDVFLLAVKYLKLDLIKLVLF